MSLTDWLKNNGWSLAIAVFTIVSVVSLYGYRIDQLEGQTAEIKASIQTINAQQVQLQVQLAQISTDLNYIKASVDRIRQ